jgi:hypothetical protein
MLIRTLSTQGPVNLGITDLFEGEKSFPMVFWGLYWLKLTEPHNLIIFACDGRCRYGVNIWVNLSIGVWIEK